jgi:hypothetical protein
MYTNHQYMYTNHQYTFWKCKFYLLRRVELHIDNVKDRTELSQWFELKLEILATDLYRSRKNIRWNASMIIRRWKGKSLELVRSLLGLYPCKIQILKVKVNIVNYIIKDKISF